ncbi:MAG: hypothetical protein AB7F65_09795 [Dehalococcoidia bacterium]
MTSIPGEVVGRGLRGRGWFARLLLALAVVALLTPSLAAMEPGLAGWSSSHGHLFADGVAVEHTHPWEASSDGAAADGVTFTWDDASTVFAVAVPVVAVLALTATIFVALDRVRPVAPRPVFARIPTPPPR